MLQGKNYAHVREPLDKKLLHSEQKEYICVSHILAIFET